MHHEGSKADEGKLWIVVLRERSRPSWPMNLGHQDFISAKNRVHENHRHADYREGLALLNHAYASTIGGSTLT
jgi:hypothetical protein